MAINLDPAQSASPSAGRLDRHDAEARQDRWMMELERAMFSTSAKKQGAVVPQSGQGSAHQETARPDGADTGQGSASAREAGRQASNVQTDQHAPAETASARAHANPQGALVAGVRAQGNASVGAGFSAGATAANGPLAGSRSNLAASLSTLTAPSVSSEQASTVQLEQAKPSAASSPALFGQSAEPVPNNTDAATLGPDMAEQAGAGTGEPADAAEFDKRLMHLFAGPDGMHAYIRDAELGAAQARSVAAALDVELALSGQPLATLTVNGKRVALANKEASGVTFEDGAAPADRVEPDTVRPYFHSLTPVRKEPSE
jgi:hypothetical protein